MTLPEAVTLIENKGVGFALILGAGLGLYWLGRGVKQFAEDFYALFKKAVENHLHTMQESMKTLVENSGEANRMLGAQNQMLGLHGKKLDEIAEQTKKQV